MTLTWKERLLYAFLTLGLLGLVVLYALEIYYFKRTFDLKPLLLGGALVGLILGLFLGWRLSRTAEDAVDRIQVFLFWIALGVIFMPLLASLSNRWFSPHPAQVERVVFFEERPYISERFGLFLGASKKPSGYYLFFMREGKLERIDNRSPLRQPRQRGDTLDISVKKGLWGAKWVELTEPK